MVDVFKVKKVEETESEDDWETIADKEDTKSEMKICCSSLN